MPDYSWPPMDQRRVMGRALNRLDGPAKSSGRARYSQDVVMPGMLFSALLTCPHPHARITSVDTSEAESAPGVSGVQVTSGPGTEIQWAGTEVAMVSANTEERARDAIRMIKVEYEVFDDHLVKEDDLAKAQSMNRASPSGEVVTGDPDQALADADVVSEGDYGIPVLTHCCHETHGQVIGFDGEHVEYSPSTQFVSGVGGEVAKSLEIPATNVHVHQDHMGGGFGSKFSSDRWGSETALLSKSSGGRPVKFHLDRRTDLIIAGNRPSFYGHIKMGAKKDGTITAWDSKTWSTGGFGGGGLNANLAPYVFSNVPNRRINHSAVSTNTGGSRAWRAPNHPQLSYLTCSAIEDLAAAIKMDALEVFLKNFQYTDRADVYPSQLKKAAEMVDWARKWHPRGDSGSGHVKRGLGIGVGTWTRPRPQLHGHGHDPPRRRRRDRDRSRRTSAPAPAPSSRRSPRRASAWA